MCNMIHMNMLRDSTTDPVSNRVNTLQIRNISMSLTHVYLGIGGICFYVSTGRHHQRQQHQKGATNCLEQLFPILRAFFLQKKCVISRLICGKRSAPSLETWLVHRDMIRSFEIRLLHKRQKLFIRDTIYPLGTELIHYIRVFETWLSP